MSTAQQYLSDKDVAEILAKTRAPSVPQRDRIVVELLLATGARASELLGIEVTDFNDDRQTVRIATLKQNHKKAGKVTKPKPLIYREIPLRADLYAEAKSLVPAGKLFPFKYCRLWQIWKKFSGTKTHASRHNYATKLYGKSKDILVVQHGLGHKNINNTARYIHLADMLDKLRQALV